MVKNKKAWLRIVEAFLAIIMIISSVVIIMDKKDFDKDVSKDVYEKQKYILRYISKNQSLRNDILSNQTQRINNLIKMTSPSSWNYTTKICSVEDICNAKTPINKDIYVVESLIVSNLTSYDAKKIRFFVWLK